MVSAFAARQRLVLAQTELDEKSNEIVAIPAVVTIDAMGCQREIARKIVGKKADYILALKGNQGALRENVELFANEQKTTGFTDTTVSVDETIDGDDGRIETRRVTVRPRRRLTAAAARLARPGGRRHRRERPRDRDANRTRDPLLSHVLAVAR